MTGTVGAPARPWEMKPSDAIRIGIRYLPIQTFGYEHDESGEASGCAVDAMMKGYGIDGQLPTAHPFVEPLSALDCPEGCPGWQGEDWEPRWGAAEGSYIVAHLNDTHRWTREDIAAWLEERGL